MVNTILNTDGKNVASSTAGSSTISNTIPVKLLEQLSLAVKRNLILRPLAAQVFGPQKGSSLYIPLQVKDTMDISSVSEGAEIPLDAEEYTSYELKPFKYGVRILIPREVMEDGLFDYAQLNINTAAHEIGKNEETLIVATLDAGDTAAGNGVANSNATIAITDITEAMQNLESDDYTPTDMIVGVEVANDLRNIDAFNEADKTGAGSAANGQKLIGSIYGMNVIVSNSVSSVLAYVIDRTQAFVIYDKRALTIENWSDVVRDSMQIVVTQRFATRYHRAGAISEITTT